MTQEIKLAFVGDVMCGDVFSLIGRGAGTMIDRYGYTFLTEEIIDILKAHDMVMGNIECVLSDVGRKDKSLRRSHMRGRVETAKLLSAWGFTIANVANNHIFEQGRDAALDTVANLKKTGIRVIGAGANDEMAQGIELTELNIKGHRLILLGICLRNERYAYDGGGGIPQVLEKIRKFRQNGDLLIASVHWGDELIEYPDIWQRDLATLFQDAGIDVLAGHHPHIYQGVDQIDSMLVAYSLGNFIFDGTLPATSWSVIWSITVQNDKSFTYELIPIIRGKHFRPHLAHGSLKVEILEEIKRRNEFCRWKIENEDIFLQNYQKRVSILRQNNRKKLWKNIAQRFFHFKPVYWPQLLMRPIQRRMGTW